MSDSAVGGREAAINRMPSLDGIQAVGISMVVLSHLSGAPGFFDLPGESSRGFGDTGARVFFVLSGLLITTLSLAEQTKSGGINLPRFYLRRCFRIFRAFYIYLAILAGASALGWILLLPGDLAKAALYIVDYYGSNWTSNFARHILYPFVEEQFYLLWPFAIWAAGVRRAKWLAVCSIVATGTIDRCFDCLSDASATGCLLAGIGTAWNRSAPYRAVIRSRWMHITPLIVRQLQLPTATLMFTSSSRIP